MDVFSIEEKFMKAIYFEAHGDASVLQYGDLPMPEPRQGQALVRVKAVALNHLDIWVRRGWKGLNLALPHIGGSDVSGEVVTVCGESSFRPGDRVVIDPGISTLDDEWTRTGRHSMSPGYQVFGEQVPGGLAEYAVVPLSNLFLLSDDVSFEQGAAPLLVGTTVWKMLFHSAKLHAGQSVLVVGSGGGVNSLTTQIASAVGAHVIVLAGSQEKAERAVELGASHTINYREVPQWSREVLSLTQGRGVDVVVDNVGQATIVQSLKAVTRGGTVVTVGNTSGHELIIDNRFIFTKQISLVGSTMGSPQDFRDAMTFLEHQGISVIVDTVAPLEQGIEQLKRLEQGDHFGKIVLQC